MWTSMLPERWGRAWGWGHPASDKSGNVGLGIFVQGSGPPCAGKNLILGMWRGPPSRGDGPMLLGQQVSVKQPFLSDTPALHPGMSTSQPKTVAGVPCPTWGAVSFLPLQSCELGAGGRYRCRTRNGDRGSIRILSSSLLCSDPVKDYVQANPGWYWAS